MKISLERCTLRHLPRLVQLLQRSNQFNLATRRYSEAQCGSFMNDVPGHLPLCVTLSDKYGDYGLISAVIVSWRGTEAVIEEWVMSCRVLFRGVEQCVMNFIFDTARQKGLRRVTGNYIPSDKNKMVKDFYHDFGFKPGEGAGIGGGSRWALDVSQYKPIKTHMEIGGLCLPQNA